MHQITTAVSQALHGVAATRDVERNAQATLPAHTLMARAGFAVARLTMALAPHAQCIWIACGPGNNGGDGLEAAAHLQTWAHMHGKRVVVTWTGHADQTQVPPPDAAAAYATALAAGVVVSAQAPDDFDFCVDALLGIGGSLSTHRPSTALIVQWLRLIHSGRTPCLAVDIPTGLNTDTGSAKELDAIFSIAKPAINTRAIKRYTLSLLTLKPGLFTAQGRDHAGQVWFDDLGVDTADVPPTAQLLGADHSSVAHRSKAAQASHKGTFGDVSVIGGQSSGTNHMTGAALLAARAALQAGAGRVMVTLLSGSEQAPHVDPFQPELMFRSLAALDLARQTVVCGCGGGDAVTAVLPAVLATSRSLVLDADALNAIALSVDLQTALRARGADTTTATVNGGAEYRTVLTPHPLEAARLLGSTTDLVQADRLAAAQALAERFHAVVVLKGSGTVIAAPGITPRINASGNALLATAGTGDVLAGMIGANLARGMNAWDAACSAVFAHGALADAWALSWPDRGLTASVMAAAAQPYRQDGPQASSQSTV